MTPTPPRTRLRRLVTMLLSVAALVAPALAMPAARAAGPYEPITGSGSSWSSPMLDEWRRDVQASNISVSFNGNGSSAGRSDFIQGGNDFAVSEIPFQRNPEPGESPEEPSRSYAYMPIVAGGTSFMYNLKVAGQRVTNLRLSGPTITKIFTGVITDWADPAITADYGAQLPSKPIVPIVRSDGSGTSAQFTRWMSRQYPDLWHAFCGRMGRDPNCGFTSNYPPKFANSHALNGSLGVQTYVSADYGDGAIGYVEYSYPLLKHFPVVKVLNAAGYYVEPTAPAVAVALSEATINNDESSPDYLTQQLDGVYNSTDPRAYPLSSYSYMIIPTKVEHPVTEDKGRTLADFAYYFLCQGQAKADGLGFSPLPVNLVQAAFDQVKKIPGADVQNLNIASCHNPTFNADGSNRLAELAPAPPACDAATSAPCTSGTAGADAETTNVPPVVPAAPAAGGDTSGGAAGDPGAQPAAGTDPVAAAPGPTAPVTVPAGSTVAADGSVKSAAGKQLAPPGSVKAPAGSTVTSDGNIKAPNGTVISGAKAAADAAAARKPAATTLVPGAKPAAGSTTTGSGGFVIPASAGGGGGLVLAGGASGTTVGSVPVASSTQLAAAPSNGIQIVLFLMTAAALVGAVLVPPLLARRNGPRPAGPSSRGNN